MRVIGYCDFNGNSIDEQINTANTLGINHLLLRNIDNINIIDIDDETIKSLNKELRSNKMDILALDPSINSYDLYDVDAYDASLINYEKAFIIANKLKVVNVIYKLPVIKDILDEFETYQKQLDKLIEISKKYKITLLIKPTNEKTNVLVYILKKYKKRDLSLIFDPRRTILNGESPIVAYRLLKDFFEIFVASDVDKKDNPELLGYGRVKVIDLFKRMNRDQYKGYFVLDDSFANFVEPEEKKVPWFKKLFTKSTNINNYLRGYSIRIFPNEEEREVTLMDIYENQISVLKVSFRLKD